MTDHSPDETTPKRQSVRDAGATLLAAGGIAAAFGAASCCALPMLLGSFIQRDLLDDLCLTIAPYVVGGLARRIATGPGQLQTPIRCTHVLTDDAGYLYTRYVKA